MLRLIGFLLSPIAILISFLIDKVMGKSTITQYRELKTVIGNTEIDGIEYISDDRIMEIHREVHKALEDTASARGEIRLLTYQVMDCITRDRLIDETNRCYVGGLEKMKRMHRTDGIESLFIKGRSYSGLF